MGYTHSWKTSGNMNWNDWENFMVFSFTAITKTQGETKEYSDIEIVGEDGHFNSTPRVDWTEISFNGLGENGHEAFYIIREKNSRSTFCKTARKPYDVVVVACLIAAKRFNIIKEWNSDGSKKDHKQGEELYKKIACNLTS